MLTNNAMIVIRNSDNKVICELVTESAINAAKNAKQDNYRLVPVLEHLQSLNKPNKRGKRK